jgi:hypothetical protein
MEIALDCEYHFEEIKTCQLCKQYIENKFHRVRLCNKICYYHTSCLESMLKKMEMLGFLYS